MSGTTYLSEPLELLTREATDVAAHIAAGLRARGWDSNVNLTAPATGKRIVSIDITLAVLVPIEAVGVGVVRAKYKQGDAT